MFKSNKVSPALPEFTHPHWDVDKLVRLIEQQIALYRLPAGSKARADDETILDHLEYYLTAYAQGVRKGIIKNSNRLPFKISPSSLNELQRIPFSDQIKSRILGLQEDDKSASRVFYLYFSLKNDQALCFSGDPVDSMAALSLLENLTLINPAIKALDIGKTTISNEISQRLGSLLRKSSTIVILDLSKATYDDGLLADLIDTLASNLTLTQVKFNEHNKVNQDLVGAVNRLIQRNQRLSGCFTIDILLNLIAVRPNAINHYIITCAIPQMNYIGSQEDWNALKASRYFKTLVDSASGVTKTQLENFSPANLKDAAAPSFKPARTTPA